MLKFSCPKEKLLVWLAYVLKILVVRDATILYKGVVTTVNHL